MKQMNGDSHFNEVFFTNVRVPKDQIVGKRGEGWFVAFRCYTKYVQLSFFRGTSLDPVPPKGSKHPEVRYFDIHEDDELDEDQLVSWVQQASSLPGEKM